MILFFRRETMSRRKFSYTIFRHFTNDTNMKRKAEIWKQAIKEVMCYSHHLEHIWLYSIIIFYIGDPLAALFTKCHLFVTSGIIWILYIHKKKLMLNRKCYNFIGQRDKDGTPTNDLSPQMCRGKLYSTLACSLTTDNTFIDECSLNKVLIVVFGWDLEWKTSE